jgi:hypothetical protein
MACHTERSLPRSAFDFWPKLLVRSAGLPREQKCGSRLKTKTPNSALVSDVKLAGGAPAPSPARHNADVRLLSDARC